MRDYLSDLVTKNIGTAEIIQPRRASRFEPAQPQNAFETETSLFQAADFGDFEEERTVETAHINPRRASKTESRETNAAISSPVNPEDQIRTSFIEPAKPHAPEIKQIVSRVKRASEEIEAPPETVELKISEEKRFETKDANKKNSEAANSEAKDLEEETVETPAPIVAKPRVTAFENRFEETAKPQTITPLSKEQTPQQASDRKKIHEATIEQTIIPTPREQTSQQIRERAEKPETANRQTVISFPRAQTLNQFSDLTETPEATVINVTIGRVEVRAVTASAPPKNAHRAKPQTMGLDEYLQKRGNGGER
jgi:hypothetical protein